MKRFRSKISAALAAGSLVAITQIPATTPDSLTKADSGLAASSPPASLHETLRAGCARAMAQGAVCEAANKRAIELMNARGLEAATLVLDVQTGALVAFAATPRSNATGKDVQQLKVTTPVLPLSLTKLFLAASWWDRDMPDSSFDCIRSAAPQQTELMTIQEMIAIGCDLPAKQMAVTLRKSVGAEAVLEDLERFGFGPRSKSLRDNSFWAGLAPKWRDTLVPASSYTLLSAKTKDSEWADTLFQGYLIGAQKCAGDMAGARATAQQMLGQLETLSQKALDSPPLAAGLSFIHAVLGEKDAAIKEGERAIMLLPSEKDAVDGPKYEERLASIEVLVGDKYRAIPTLQRLSEIPYIECLTPALLRLDPKWDPLRGDPRFQKLCEAKKP